MIEFPLRSLPRPKDTSPEEMFKTVGKAILVAVGAVVLLAPTVVWALATTARTVIRWMVEQITQLGAPNSKKE